MLLYHNRRYKLNACMTQLSTELGFAWPVAQKAATAAGGDITLASDLALQGKPRISSHEGHFVPPQLTQHSQTSKGPVAAASIISEWVCGLHLKPRLPCAGTHWSTWGQQPVTVGKEVAMALSYMDSSLCPTLQQVCSSARAFVSPSRGSCGSEGLSQSARSP